MSKKPVSHLIDDSPLTPGQYTSENVAIDVPSKKAKLTEKIEEAINSYENGTIKNVVTDYMPGFLDPAYQGLIKQVKKDFFSYANPQYVNKNTFNYSYNNPSTLNLILPIQFTEDDGTALPNTTVAVNAWPGNLSKASKFLRIIRMLT